MAKSSILAVSALAVVLASVMVLSPLGSPLVVDVEKDITNGMQTVGAALGAMFPQSVNAGPLPQNDILRIGVSLPLQNPQQLSSFVQAVSSPGSSQFRQFITPAEFASTYSPSEASYLQLESYFEGYGLHMETSSNRLILGVTGNPTQMGAAFHTSFAQYRFPDGTMYYGPTSAPQIPLSLGVSGAFGFTNALFNKPAFVTNPVTPGASGAIPLASCSGGDTPAEIRSAYLVSSLPSGDTGTGMKLSTVDAYDSSDKQATLTSDMSTFDSACSLATPTLVYNYPVLSTTYNSSSSSGWGGEEDLDMEWSHSMAPGATIEMTFSPDSGNGLYEAVDSLVADNTVNVITLSWGEPDVGIEGGASCSFECNASTDGSYAILHPILQAANAEGITVFVASGDCGAADGTNTASTDYPSSDVDSTGVGGTVLTLSGSAYGSESAWSGNDSGSSCQNQGGAGGGWGPEPQPWYQSGTGVKDKGLRGVPDVGITVGTPLATYSEGGWGGYYGTSDGAPQWAGLAAVADQIHGGDIGLINPVLYSILRSSSYSTSFHDITTGTGNGYKPTTGWDPVTGIGTPIANVAIPEIASGGYMVTQTGLTATLSASTSAPAAKASVTFTATSSGGTGTISKYIFNFGDGNATTTNKATVTHSYATDGAYAANVEVFDTSGNSTASPFIQMSVGTTPFTLSLAASSTAPAVGTAVTFTSTASGGTSPYTFQYYFGDGTWAPLTTTATTYLHTYRDAGVYCAQVTGTDSKSPQDGAVSNVIAITVGGATGSCTGSTTSTLSSVAISPTTPSVATSGTMAFTATPTCTATCPSGTTYAWTLTSTALGTLSSATGSTPTFTAGTSALTGGIFVNATLNGVTKESSTVITVTATTSILSSVSVSPTSATLSHAHSATFTATPTCTSTCPSGTTYSWTLTRSVLGTLSATTGASVTFTAGTKNGKIGLFVNATLNGVTKQSSVVVIAVKSTLTSVSVSPTSATLAHGGTQVFKATPKCTSGCPTGTTYSWTLTRSALGTLSATTGASVTFTAGSTNGKIGLFVNATLNGVTVQSSVVVITVSTTASVSLVHFGPTLTATPMFVATHPSGTTYSWIQARSTLGRLLAVA
jgi:kumamolisin